MSRSRRTAALAVAAWVTGAVVGLPGCKASGDEPGYIVMPGMVRPVPYEAFDDNPIARVGMLKAPDGTVPFGASPVHMGKGVQEAERAGRELVNPIENTPAAIARGEKLFTTFCAVCHGDKGQGASIGVLNTAADALASQKGISGPGLKSFVDSYPDGRLFHVISRGGPAVMPSYAVQIATADRWRLVHYLRSVHGAFKPPAAATETASSASSAPPAGGSAGAGPAASSAGTAAGGSAEPAPGGVAPPPAGALERPAPTAAPPATAPTAPAPTEKAP